MGTKAISESRGSAAPPPIPVLFRVPWIADTARHRTRRRRRIGLLAALMALSVAPLVALVLHVSWQWYATATEATSVGPWPIAIRRPAVSPTMHDWHNVATVDDSRDPSTSDVNPPNRIRVGRVANVGSEGAKQ